MREALVALSLFIGVLATLPAPSAQPARYRDVLSTYRRGEFDEAVAALAQLPKDERYRGARDVAQSSLRPFRRDVLQAVLTLQTDLSFATHVPVGCTSSNADFDSPDVRGSDGLMLAESPLFEYALLHVLNTRFPDDDFLQTWYLAVIAFAQNWQPGGADCFANAPARIQRHPEMQLAFGAMHEKQWLRNQFEGWTPPTLRPSLQVADRAFRAALSAAPDLDEARVRLGRVLLLQSKPDDALETFRPVRDRLDRGFAYLVRMFEGEAYEQRSDASRAQESYAAAHDMMPHAESAIVALGNLAFARGRRVEALDILKRLNDASAAGTSKDPWVWRAQGADPWGWYHFGTNWRFPTYLAKLRSLVR